MEAILKNFFYDVWIKRFVFLVTSITVIICFFGCLTIFISRVEADNISKKPKIEAFVVNKDNMIDKNKSLALVVDKEFDSLIKNKDYNILSSNKVKEAVFIGFDEIIEQRLGYNLDKSLVVLDIKDKKKQKKEPLEEKNKTKSSFYTIVTAYNSEAAQCDSSPCITANGYNLCKYNKEDSVAVNSLSFGTKIKIPAVFGDKVFTVRDRMHSKYYNRVDIWMINKEEAISFGYKRAKVEIID